jgi:hypothetical protein
VLSFSKRTPPNRSAERDRHVQIALVHAVLSIAPASSTPANGTLRRDRYMPHPVDLADGRGRERTTLVRRRRPGRITPARGHE